MADAYYFYLKNLGDGRKFLGTLRGNSQCEFTFDYVENPVRLVGKPRLPLQHTVADIKYCIMDTLAPPLKF